MSRDVLSVIEKVRVSVSLGESHFREFKSAFSGPPGKKQARPVRDICKDIAEALVAFANADGGEILIGIEDDGEITGTGGHSPEELATILNAPASHVLASTPLQSVRKTVVELDGYRVLTLSVPKSTLYIHQTSDGRCLRRNDLETIPIATQAITLDRAEARSREYDREFVDGASVADLDADLLQIVADQISHGMSSEKCLQYLGLAEYAGPERGVLLRRGAMLLFAKDIGRWHPRCQVRVMKVNGNTLGIGASYNVANDEIVSENICRIIDKSWDQLRPYLVQTTLKDDARFKTTFVYPENACREALVNAVAHRDYSDEGAGIEIYVFDDRIEVKSPGGLLSTIKVEDIKAMRGTHQSRNSYVARSLRELGYMRELGEGMRRIFELMKSNELAPPDIIDAGSSFSLTLHHKAMYSREEELWLDQFSQMTFTSQHKAIALLGRNGQLFSTQNIIDRVGIVDIEHYRQLVDFLLKTGVLISEISKVAANNIAKRQKIGVRDVPRFRIVPVSEIKPNEIRGRGVASHKQPKVVRDREPQGFDVFVGNIDKNTTEEEIFEALSHYGHILSITYPGQPEFRKGYAFVHFSTETSAHNAVAATPAPIVQGRSLAIRLAHDRLSTKPARKRGLRPTPSALSTT